MDIWVICLSKKNGNESEIVRVKRFYEFLGLKFVNDIDLKNSGIN